MKLKPLKKYNEGNYASIGRRICGGVFLVASLSSSTLGGCGPFVDPDELDAALDSGDLDAAACDGDSDECDAQ